MVIRAEIKSVLIFPALLKLNRLPPGSPAHWHSDITTSCRCEAFTSFFLQHNHRTLPPKKEEYIPRSSRVYSLFTMGSKLFTGDPTKVMVIRQVAPQITTLSVPFSRFGLIKFGGRATLGIYHVPCQFRKSNRIANGDIIL